MNLTVHVCSLTKDIEDLTFTSVNISYSLLNVEVYFWKYSLTNGYWECEELAIFSFEWSHFSFLKTEKQL